MGKRLPVFESKLTPKERMEKRSIVAGQLQAIIRGDDKIQCAGVGCFKRQPLWRLYKCLYCGMWLCKECAEKHFGYRVPSWQESVLMRAAAGEGE
jgi:hypothetical protein